MPVGTIRQMVLLREKNTGTGKISFYFGYTEFQMPEIHVTGDTRQVEEWAGLDMELEVFSIQKEDKIHIQ